MKTCSHIDCCMPGCGQGPIPVYSVNKCRCLQAYNKPCKPSTVTRENIPVCSVCGNTLVDREVARTLMDYRECRALCIEQGMPEGEQDMWRWLRNKVGTMVRKAGW